ncbi:MAG: transglycosylase SLT domain-containing protein [Bacteriovoracia bacterium]
MPNWLVPLGAVAVGLALTRDASGSDGSSTDPFMRWDTQIRQAAQKHRVPWRWIKAVMMNESNLGRAPSVARGLAFPADIDGSKSSDGKSWGLMQVTLPTAREMRPGTTEADLNNPAISIDLGAQYLAKMIARFGLSNRDSVARAYNGGPGFMQSERGRTMTAQYLEKFLKNLAEVQKRQPGPELEY